MPDSQYIEIGDRTLEFLSIMIRRPKLKYINKRIY